MNVTGLIARRERECARVDFLRPYRSAAGYGAALGETAGQRAYRAVPRLAASFDTARAQRRENLSRGGHRWTNRGATVADLAAQLGVSYEVLMQARRLHDRFATDAAARAEWEPQILRAERPVGLGTALKRGGAR